MTIRLYELVGSDPERPFSPHCWKTAMSLAHKGLEWESVPTSFTQIASVPGEAGIVPVIEDASGETIADSFAIALYLEERYPDRPSLFKGDGGKAMARFVENWVQTQVHSILGMAALLDIHDALEPDDRAYFRKSREARFGAPLEQTREKGQGQLPSLTPRLGPLRWTLKQQPFIGGQSPLFADYIVFGAFQWMRAISPVRYLEADDPVSDWFERCLDLHGGIGRRLEPLGRS